MEEIIRFLIRHGYMVLFVGVFTQQMGLPIPAFLFLLAAGFLVSLGALSFGAAFGIAVMAALAGDIFWYLLGRYRGKSILSLLCRISFSPDSCVHQTTNLFSRHGAKLLLVAKFIPGLNTVAPPLAGVSRMNLFRFLLFDVLGSSLWIGSFGGLAYLFGDEIEKVATYSLKLGIFLGVIVAGGLAAYLFWEYLRRQKSLRQ